MDLGARKVSAFFWVEEGGEEIATKMRRGQEKQPRVAQPSS
jgi:hypothetical protein